MTLIESARLFAHQAHDSIGQKRKYTGEPYWVHTDEVAERVASVTDSESMIIAAHLHDILEDVTPQDKWGRFNLETIRALFGDLVAHYVMELTDVFTKENFPTLNRKQRKEQERKRVAMISNEAKTIKLADLISNTKDIVVHNPEFAKVYLREKDSLLPYLSDGNRVLFHEAVFLTRQGFETLGL